MKIAFVNCLYFPNEVGGAERAVRMLAEENVARGNESVVICLSKDNKYKTGTVNGVKIYYIPLFNIGFLHGDKPLPSWRRKVWHLIDAYNPVMGKRVARILRREKPDVVETNNLQGFSVSVVREISRMNIPMVQMLHDYYWGCANSSFYRNGINCGKQCADCRFLSYPRRSASRLPDAVISVSRRTFDILSKAGMFPDTRTPLANPTALRLDDFRTMPRKAPRQAAAPLVIGYLGRLTQIKGIEPLLSAVGGFERVRLLIGGTGEPDYVAALKELAPANATFLGNVVPSEFFQRIDVLFVPSIWEEPYGRVLCEAYASGVPIAVSRMGGMPEALIEGQTGITFEPTTTGICEAISQLAAADFPREEHIAACYEAARRYDAAEVYERQRLVWMSVLSPETARHVA